MKRVPQRSPGSRDKARDELIDEKIKLQEAKRLNAVAEDDDVNKILTGIAERNKMTLEQFTQHMKGMGQTSTPCAAASRPRFHGAKSCGGNSVIMVAITERDVDKFVADAPAGGASADDVELQVQRITLTMPAKTDQGAIAQTHRGGRCPRLALYQAARRFRRSRHP